MRNKNDVEKKKRKKKRRNETEERKKRNTRDLTALQEGHQMRRASILSETAHPSTHPFCHKKEERMPLCLKLGKIWIIHSFANHLISAPRLQVLVLSAPH